MARKVLITGATGDTGPAAVKEATALGLESTCDQPWRPEELPGDDFFVRTKALASMRTK
jgi:hypothetical protein